MNFLAHLKLAENNPSSRMGNWLGDFVKGLPWDDRFDKEIWQGIMEHRHLDVFTDNHPAWQRSKDRLKPENRRYAGIVVDIFYDFHLSKHWQQFSTEQSLDQFIAEVHRDLKLQKAVVPKDTRRILNAMIRQKWLASYGNIEGVAKTLRRVARVSPRLKEVKGLDDELIEKSSGFEADFLEFFPDALVQVEKIRINVQSR